MTAVRNIPDDVMAIVVHMAEGNPGALTAISEMMKTDYARSAMALGHMKAYGITGPLIWLCYKDICGHNPALLMELAQDITGGKMELALKLQALPYSGYTINK